MFDFLQRLLYFVLSIQEKFLSKNLGENSKLVYTNTTSKRVMTTAASLELTSKTEQNKIKLENNIKIILNKCENNPEKLLSFIEKSGTKVYKIPNGDKILRFIKYEEGFVAETKGLKGLYLNIILSLAGKEKMNFSHHTKPMFLLRDLPLDKYYMIQQFHKWYAMKLNLPGFDAKNQENFQRFLNSDNENTKSLSIEEIIGLKEAIARDVEAINFIVDLARNTDGSRKAHEKITTGGASV